MDNQESRIYIVAMKEHSDDEMSIWTSPFTSREKAEAFVAQVKQRLARYGMENEWQIDIDSGEMNDDQYLDWIDARYEDEEAAERLQAIADYIGPLPFPIEPSISYGERLRNEEDDDK